ncbi:MAG: hypothetical protein PHP86_18840 [Nevskiales bacterium]|nr:hypothetical protein [Nevskiales bacterium]
MNNRIPLAALVATMLATAPLAGLAASDDAADSTAKTAPAPTMGMGSGMGMGRGQGMMMGGQGNMGAMRLNMVKHRMGQVEQVVADLKKAKNDHDRVMLLQRDLEEQYAHMQAMVQMMENMQANKSGGGMMGGQGGGMMMRLPMVKQRMAQVEKTLADLKTAKNDHDRIMLLQRDLGEQLQHMQAMVQMMEAMQANKQGGAQTP